MKILSRSKRDDEKNMTICQFWGREFMSLSQKYEERVQKFSFLHDSILKQNYILGKCLSELYWILLCF